MNLAKEFFEALKTLKKAHHCSINDIAMNHSQLVVLMSIDKFYKKNKRLPTPSQISEHLEVTPATITPALNKLEDSGLLRREYSKKDRRQVFVGLTDEGQKQTEEINKKMGEQFNEMIDFIGEESVKHFLEFTKKLEEYNVSRASRASQASQQENPSN